MDGGILMKTSSKLKIVAAILTVLGIGLIIFGILTTKEISECTNCGQGWEGHREVFGESYFTRTEVNIAPIVVGGVLTFVSIPLWFIGFGPQMTKMGARLQSETMDVAGEDIQEAASKTIDVAEPHVKRMTKTTAGAIKEGLKGDPREELEKAQNLYDEGLINEEEYEALRKKILGL